MKLAWAGTPRDMRQVLASRTGLPVECQVLANDTIGVMFEVLSGPKPWRKPFSLDKANAVPDAFLSMLDQWRGEMQQRFKRDDVRGTLLGAVVDEYGEEAVRAALAKRELVVH